MTVNVKDAIFYGCQYVFAKILDSLRIEWVKTKQNKKTYTTCKPTKIHTHTAHIVHATLFNSLKSFFKQNYIQQIIGQLQSF